MQQTPTNYSLLAKQLTGLLDSQDDFLTNQSQFTGLIYHSLKDVSWAGFYWLKDPNILRLGSYQGPVACASINLGQGVCGMVAEQQQSILVKDVSHFETHIACDARSQSELVCPVIKNEVLAGVFDIDSYSKGRFDSHDQQGIEGLLAQLVESTDFKIVSKRIHPK